MQTARSESFQEGNVWKSQGPTQGSLNVATAFMKALREKVVINEHGKRRTVTKLEAALKQLVNKAASGDIRLLRELVELARDAEDKQSKSGSQDSTISDLDQEVMESFLRRFQPMGEQTPAEERNNGGNANDERS